MEKIEGGSCSYALAGIALGAAVGSIFFPPAAYPGGAAVSAWMGKCL
ncbi:MAG: hypothetical protein KF862_23100 [Chitinophagaceae bacterium]|nr:hypothetical protein [Chitinophagaceae bacterium]